MSWSPEDEEALLLLERAAMEYSRPWFLNTRPGEDDPGTIGWDLWHNGGPGGQLLQIPSALPEVALWIEASANALPEAIAEIRRLRGLLAREGIA